jgi:hypothetical protein
MVENNLKEIKRVLRNGGIAKIQFRCIRSHGKIFRFFYWYYGIDFNKNELNNMILKLGLLPIKYFYTNKKELWVIFKKNK